MEAFLFPHEISELAAGLSKNPGLGQTAKSASILGRLGYFRLGGNSRLNNTQWQAVADGLEKDAGKVEKARLAAELKKVGFVPKSRTTNKPGPAKKETTNTTVKELQRLHSDLRAHLEVGPDLPRLAVLQLTLLLLSEIDELLGNHLFFAPDDLARIQSLRNRASNCQIDFLREFLPRLDNLIATFNTTEALVAPTLTKLIDDAASRVSDTTEGKSLQPLTVVLPENENDVLIKFAVLLGLDDSAGLRRIAEEEEKQKKQSKVEMPNSTEASKSTPTELNSGSCDITIASDTSSGIPPCTEHAIQDEPFVLGEYGITRTAILRTVLGRLRHLHQLFVDTDQGLHVDDIILVYDVLQDEMSWSDPGSEATPILEGLQSVFLDACHRQGINPFFREKLEDFILASEPAIERGISTGGYLDGRRSTRASVNRHPFKRKKSTVEKHAEHVVPEKKKPKTARKLRNQATPSRKRGEGNDHTER